jgi:hypothetical protein
MFDITISHTLMSKLQDSKTFSSIIDLKVGILNFARALMIIGLQAQRGGVIMIDFLH